jgi:hypothetical protein
MTDDSQDGQLQQRAETKVGRQGRKPVALLSHDEQLYQVVYQSLAAPLPPGLPASFSQEAVRGLRQQQPAQRAKQYGEVGLMVGGFLVLSGLGWGAPSFVTEILAGLWHAKGWLLPGVLFVVGFQLLDYQLGARRLRKPPVFR